MRLKLWPLVLALLVCGAQLLAATFSEDFNCADADSLNCDVTWTEDLGDNFDIVSNRADGIVGGFGKMTARVTGSTTATANQYWMCSVLNDGNTFPEVILRHQSAAETNDHYALQINATDDKISWVYYTNSDDTSSDTVEEITGITIDAAVTYPVGATIDGTGTSTVIRVWMDATGTGPTAADNWNGDSTPNASFTANPATAVDDGNAVGIGGYAAGANAMHFDTCFFGDIPVGGGAPNSAPRGSFLLNGVGR